MNCLSLSARWSATIFAAGLLAACAAADPDSRRQPSMDEMLLQLTEQKGRACFYISDVAGFGTLDDDVVSVSTRFNREYYLVTTAFSCSWLSTTFNLGFQGPGGQVCGPGANLVGAGSTCPVRHVFAFPSRDDAMTAWELAKAKRDVQKQYSVPQK